MVNTLFPTDCVVSKPNVYKLHQLASFMFVFVATWIGLECYDYGDPGMVTTLFLNGMLVLMFVLVHLTFTFCPPTTKQTQVVFAEFPCVIFNLVSCVTCFGELVVFTIHWRNDNYIIFVYVVLGYAIARVFIAVVCIFTAVSPNAEADSPADGGSFTYRSVEVVSITCMRISE
jgi:hypothetical protein